MSKKQLLIYETVVPVSPRRHGDLSFEPTGDYTFSERINAVPLMAVEFLAAAAEYAIVFTEVGADLLPAAVLGVKGSANLYVGPDHRWTANYIPAFIRRYPFVFASGADPKLLTMCLDEAHPGFNREGRGRRLFGADGQASDYLNEVLKFLKEYQGHYERTRRFGQRLRELDLLEPVRAEFSTPGGGKLQIGGMQCVSRVKLRALAAGQLEALARTDELELLYLQMYSMRNIVAVKDRLLGSLSEDRAVAPAAAAASEGPATLQ